jgi:hypothetical protein
MIEENPFNPLATEESRYVPSAMDEADDLQN